MIKDMQKMRRWKYVTDDGEELYFRTQSELIRYQNLVEAVDEMEDRAEREVVNRGSPFRD